MAEQTFSKEIIVGRGETKSLRSIGPHNVCVQYLLLNPPVPRMYYSMKHSMPPFAWQLSVALRMA